MLAAQQVSPNSQFMNGFVYKHKMSVNNYNYLLLIKLREYRKDTDTEC